MPSHIVITGPMGAGKTTLGSALATRLGWAFSDSDEAIILSTGMTGRQIVAMEGVPYLHRLERETLEKAITAIEPSVIAAAASVMDLPELVAGLIEDGHAVLFIDTTIDPFDRAGSHRRPMTSTESKELNRRRRDAARTCGAIFVPRDAGESVAETSATVAGALGLWSPSLFDD